MRNRPGSDGNSFLARSSSARVPIRKRPAGSHAPSLERLSTPSAMSCGPSIGTEALSEEVTVEAFV